MILRLLILIGLVLAGCAALFYLVSRWRWPAAGMAGAG